MTEVLTYEALKADRDALADRVNALAVENAALINSSVCTLQDGRPQHGFYASEWFIAKLKNGQYAALKALPEEYSHDYRTNDGTYYTKDWVVGWMQTPDTEYRPNVKTPATDAALAAIQAQGVEMLVAKIAKQLREAGGERGYNLVDWCEYAEHLEDRGEKFAAELREAK